MQWTQLLEKAKNYLKHDDLSQAMQCYENAITMRPDISDIYYSKGLLEFRIGHFDSAIKDLDVAIQLEPLYTEAINERILARIKKYAALNSNKKKKHDDNRSDEDREMPSDEKDKLCYDLDTIRHLQEQDHGIHLNLLVFGLTESIIMQKIEKQYCK